LSQYNLDYEVYDVCETAYPILLARKMVDQVDEGLDHGIVGACIVAHDRKKLNGTVSDALVKFGLLQLTFSEMPYSSRISANAIARFSPECDLATSTISSSMQMGSPLCSKWTDTATNGQLFGDVQASVAKLSFPSYS
jgi:hypothetical protein